MSNLIPGCKAIVIKSARTENIGKIVKVGSFLGEVDWFMKSDYWEVSQPILTIHGEYVNFVGGSQLQRIDNNDNDSLVEESELVLEAQ